MAGKDMKCLFAAENTPSAIKLVGDVLTKLNADLFLVDTLEDARAITTQEHFDVILAGAQLSDGQGIELLQSEIAPDTPFILVEDTVDAERVLEAMRLGAADVVHPHHAADEVMETIDRAVRRGRLIRRDNRRSRRLRKLSSKLIGDRRELRRRVDLICRDLVVAYQRLAEKVVSMSDEGDATADNRLEPEGAEGSLAAE